MNDNEFEAAIRQTTFAFSTMNFGDNTASVHRRVDKLRRILRQTPCPHPLNDHLLIISPGSTTWHKLDAPALSLGASPNCDIQLPSSYVSSTHCTLSLDAGTWTVADANSKNGIRVNDSKVSQAILKDGDFVRLADITLVYVAAIDEGLLV